jgi:phage host-nuclease inhibitor protein Gam
MLVPFSLTNDPYLLQGGPTMQGHSHPWQSGTDRLPDTDSQEAIAANGRKRTVSQFEDATLIWSFEAHIETLKDQLGRVEARAERQATEFAERSAQVTAEHAARIKALEGHIETLKAREGPIERVESSAPELAAMIHALKGQLSTGEARAERQAAEFAERAAQVAAEHAAQIKTLEVRIEALRTQLSAAETQLAERVTEHDANIAVDRMKTEAERAKAEKATARAKELEADLEEVWEWANRPWWKRIWGSKQAEISEGRPPERYQWELPSTAINLAYGHGDKGALSPLGRYPRTSSRQIDDLVRRAVSTETKRD